MIYAFKGTGVLLSFKLEFPCLNKKTEYETLLIGLFKQKFKSYVSKEILGSSSNRTTEDLTERNRLSSVSNCSSYIDEIFSSIRSEHVPHVTGGVFA